MASIPSCSTAEQLLIHIAALEEHSLSEPGLGIDELVKRVQERQNLIDQLQGFDMTQLEPGPRALANARLMQVAKATEEVLKLLNEQFEQMRQRQGQLVTARSAARGYDPEIRRENRAIDRKA